MSCPNCRMGKTDATDGEVPGKRPIPGDASFGPIPEESPSRAGDKPLGPAPARRSFFRRITDKISWLLPGIGLILMPKCPLCLAAYISAATGLTIPFAATAWFRDTLIIICVAALAWLLARTFVKLIQ